MINEALLQRIEAGETVTPDEVLRAEVEAKLADLQAEADARAQSEAVRQGQIKQRQNLIERLIFIDRQAELARRNFDLIQHEKRKAIEDFDRRAELARAEWQRSFVSFLDAFGDVCPSVKDYAAYGENVVAKHQAIEAVKNELRAKGAKLEASCYNIAGIGKSQIEVFNLPPIEFAAEPEPPKKAA